MGLKFTLALTALFFLGGSQNSFAKADPKVTDQKKLIDNLGDKNPPPASGASRLPGAAGANEKSEDDKPVEKFFPQADAFEVAGEQAAFLGAYQALYGPFGRESEDRSKLIRDTAAAIEHCLKGSKTCDEKKQIDVLRALAHYNAGLEVKKMILKNQTNREKMRSLEDTSLDESGRPKVSNEQIQKSLTTGETYEYELDVSKEKPKPRKIAKTTEFHQSHGMARQQVFQMDENLVKSPEFKDQKEKEAVTDIFSKEFGALLETRVDAEKDDTARYYKYVPAKEGSSIDVIAKDEAGNTLIDQEKFQQNRAEHSSQKIREAVENYNNPKGEKKSLEQVAKEMKLTGGLAPKIKDVEYDDILNNDNIEDADKKARIAARNLNHMFKQKAEEAAKEQGRSLADTSDTPGTEHHTAVVLGAADFDKFLDEIWPPAAKRREREEQAAAAAAAAAAKSSAKKQ